MPYVERWGEDLIAVQSDIRERELIKKISGSKWNAEHKVWSLPLSWASCITLRGVFGSDLQIGEQLNAWALARRREWVEPAMQLRTALEEPLLMVEEPNLFPFQRVGVRFLEVTGRALLADDMGSGKTIQLIRATERLGAAPVLVVCPNSMKYTWEEEIHKWTKGTHVVQVVDGTAAARRKQLQVAADWYIINWESLRLHSRLAPYGSMSLTDKEKEEKELNDIPFGTIIADEAHRAKDPKAKQTRALWHLSRTAKHRFAATGTPIESNPAELWSIMNFVSPDDFPRKSKFIDRYCQQSFNAFGGMDIVGLNHDTMAEFHAILDPRMIRRPKDVILPQLPEKVESIRYLSFTGKQKKAYDTMAHHMLAELNGGQIEIALNPLQQFLRLSQFASASAEIDEHGKVRLALPSNKVDAFMELLEEAEGEQVVAFAESKQLIHLVAEKLRGNDIPHGLITGDTNPAMRKTIMEQFQSGNLRVVLCTSAGAEGITLTAARILVFLQRFWSSVKNSQAADRIHRIGQERGVDIITFATRDTVDEYREKELADKAITLQEILKDDDIRRDMMGWGKRKRK